MPRRARIAPGGVVYHVLNRAVARLPLLQKPEDYDAFERVLVEAHRRHPIRILAHCLMPNHWHMLLHPRDDGEVTAFVRWLTHTHTMRWHAHHHTTGTGHLYQGRFKAFSVQTDAHFLTVCRYVERNALRAGLVQRAEDWRWCSLARRRSRDPDARKLVSDWPVDPPRGWLRIVNEPQTEEELAALRQAVRRGSPFGTPTWTARPAKLHRAGPPGRNELRPLILPYSPERHATAAGPGRKGGNQETGDCPPRKRPLSGIVASFCGRQLAASPLRSLLVGGLIGDALVRELPGDRLGLAQK